MNDLIICSFIKNKYIIDVNKHKDIIPYLTQQGLIVEDDFDKEWNDPTNMTLDEFKEQMLAYIDTLPWKE